MAWLKGLYLGAANVFVVSLVIAISMRTGGVVGFVLMLGGLPGVFMGIALGVLAGLTRSSPRPLRALLLAGPAVGLVFLLAAYFDCEALVPASSVPTIFAALALEHWTRQVPPPPPIPVATAQRG